MEWSMHSRVERQAIHLHEMMDRLDVDPLILIRSRQGADYAEARTRCLFCEASTVCHGWLEEAGVSDAGPDFCPNLPFFQAAKRTRTAS